MRKNALWNCKNPYQGRDKRVLCVCSAGLLRSPTIAKVLVMNGYNTRSCGCRDYALIQIDNVLIEWADIVEGVLPAGYFTISFESPTETDRIITLSDGLGALIS